MKRFLSYLTVFLALFFYWMPIASAVEGNRHAALPLMQDVKSAVRQAEARFDSGNVNGAADLARKILEKYPDNEDALALLNKCLATEKAEYEEAVASFNASKLADFKAKYPTSSYNEDVSRRIEDLPYWLTAKNADSIEGYKKYLAESKHLLYELQAKDSIKELSIKQAFDAATAKNTIQAYRDFIEEYPDNKYEKDASNRIARLMADKFNSRSTYSDKAAALAYAQNEMTRDYVNNKFSKATSTPSSSSNTSTYSSSRQQSSTTTSNSNLGTTSKGTNSTKTYRPDPSITFGVEATGEYWDRTYLLAIGPVLRFGKYDSFLFATAAVKYAKGGFHAEYTDYSSGYLHWNDINVDGKADYISVPLTANLNLLGFYFGAGLVYNRLIQTNTSLANPDVLSILLQMGYTQRHWDIKVGMNLYSTTLSSDPYKGYLTFMFGGSLYF